MLKRALLVVNNKSRSGAAGVRSASEHLISHGIEVMEHPLDHADQMSALIRRHEGKIDCVVIGGGDGSLNAAASALADTGIPLGILPTGTANDLARTLGISTDLEQAADVIVHGVPHAIDLARVNDRYFFNVANIGLGVQVTRHLSSDLKRRWGILSYARGLVSAWKAARPFHAEIVCDGRTTGVRSIQIAVGNGRHYGGGMTIAEEASIDDHLFFLYSVAPRRWHALLPLIRAARKGRFEERHAVHVEQGRHIEVRTRRPMSVTADGEVVTTTPATFDMLAGAVQVFVPTSYFAHAASPPLQQELHHATQG